MSRRADVAEHEAAHVVVGMALGLPFRAAKVGHEVWKDFEILGYTWFGGRCKVAHGVLACAGIVWERKFGRNRVHASADRQNARGYLGSGVRTGCKLANEILVTRTEILGRVARELCDRDLGPKELAAMVVGE